MNKRAKAITAAMLLTTLCITGCGGKSERGEVSKGSPVTLNGDKIYPVKCEDSLTYWMDLSPTVSTRYNNFGETPLAKELEKKTGIKVEYIHPTGQGQEQIQLLIASDELPDIVGHSWNNYDGGPQVAIDDGYILNLNDLIDEYAPAFKKTLADNPTLEKFIKNDSNNFYAFPFILEEGILQVSYGPIMRRDWLDKIGMEKPETIDEWEAVLTAFKNKCNAEVPFCSNAKGMLRTFGSGFGVFTDWYINDGKVVYGPAELGYRDYLAKMNDWYNKGLIDPDLAVVDSKHISTKFLNDKCGAIIGYSGGDIGDSLNAKKNDPSFDLVGVKYPAQEKGLNPEYSVLSAPVNMSCGVAISNNCKNPELATRYLDYGFTEDGHNLYNFGIEGKSYEWVNDYPTYTDFIMNNNEGWSMTEAMGAYMRSAYNGIMVQDKRYIEQYYRMPQQKEAQQTWMQTNMTNHLLPQLYVKKSESDRDSEAMANITTYVEEMTLKFITGQEPINNFDKYLAQLKKFGIDDAKSYRQSAYQRFLQR